MTFEANPAADSDAVCVDYSNTAVLVGGTNYTNDNIAVFRFKEGRPTPQDFAWTWVPIHGPRESAPLESTPRCVRPGMVPSVGFTWWAFAAYASSLAGLKTSSCEPIQTPSGLSSPANTSALLAGFCATAMVTV